MLMKVTYAWPNTSTTVLQRTVLIGGSTIDAIMRGFWLSRNMEYTTQLTTARYYIPAAAIMLVELLP